MDRHQTWALESSYQLNGLLEDCGNGDVGSGTGFTVYGIGMYHSPLLALSSANRSSLSACMYEFMIRSSMDLYETRLEILMGLCMELA